MFDDLNNKKKISINHQTIILKKSITANMVFKRQTCMQFKIVI